MNSSRWLLFLLMASLVAYGQDANGRIEGRVANLASGQGLRGVELRVVEMQDRIDLGEMRLPSLPVGAVSGEGGIFVIEGLRPGYYRIVPTLDGFVYARASVFSSPATHGPGVLLAGETEMLEVPMAPEAIVTGQVFHPDGTPALEVDVRLLRDTYDERGRRVHSPVSNARTDDRGEYRFFGLPAGEYYLVAAEGAAYSATYFPQTSRRDDALPFGVGAGDTLRLPSLSLRETIAETPVTFRVPDLMPETRIVRGPTVTTIEGDLPGTVSGSFRLLAPPADAPIPMETTRRIAPGPLEALLTWSRGEGLGYSYRSLRIGADPLEIDVTTDGPPIHTTGRILTDSEVDVDSVRCQLHSAFFSTQVGDGGLADPGPCYEQDLVPGAYTLEVDRLPPDAYVASASLGGEDILAGRVNVSTSTDLEVVIASPGASISGRILTDAGESLPDSVVVLVPDPPYRDAGPRYQVTTADVQGRYLLRGIAPGNYQLFAWTDLPGAAYRNAEFMSEFEGRGTPIRIEDPIALAVDLTAF